MRFTAFRAALGDAVRVVLSWQGVKSSLGKDEGRKEYIKKYANSLAYSPNLYSTNTIFREYLTIFKVFSIKLAYTFSGFQECTYLTNLTI